MLLVYYSHVLMFVARMVFWCMMLAVIDRLDRLGSG